MTEGPLLDGNAAQVRAIIEQTVMAVEKTRAKQRAGWPAWAGMVGSLVALIFGAGILRSDIAVAKEKTDKNETRIEALERDRAILARLEEKINILMEDRRR